jgi:hypothetical protein
MPKRKSLQKKKRISKRKSLQKKRISKRKSLSKKIYNNTASGGDDRAQHYIPWEDTQSWRQMQDPSLAEEAVSKVIGVAQDCNGKVCSAVNNAASRLTSGFRWYMRGEPEASLGITHDDYLKKFDDEEEGEREWRKLKEKLWNDSY